MAILQQAMLMTRSTFGPDLVRMSFEGPNLANAYYDSGSAASIWTGTSTSAVHLTTAYFKDGASALAIDAASDSLSTPYTANNAITSGDWFVGFWAEPFTTFASRYLLGVENSAGTAAGSAWFFYHDGSRLPYFFYSDGTTRTSIHSTTAITSGTEHYYACEKVGTTIYFSIDGVVKASAAFSNSLNLPSGQAITIGVSPGGSGPTGLYVDMLQIRRASVFAGANFTAPTTPIL
jgi:hypothetical protein